MNIESLLSHFDGVKETGYGKYVARCPVHEDRSPSLAIKECGDGRILLHDFAGCQTEDVLAAVGLTFADVMPERIGTEHSYKPLRSRFDARQVLECISHELMVVSILAERYAKVANDEDDKRLMLAASRINTALKAAPPLRTPPEIKAIRRAA
ncbi:MAG: DNA primase [Proteobacteria bacterium]|nr:DNA primase [Pseudomonadota bacterium]